MGQSISKQAAVVGINFPEELWLSDSHGYGVKIGTQMLIFAEPEHI